MLDPAKTFQSLKNQLDKAEMERKQRFDRVKPYKAFFWVCMAGSLYILGYALYYWTYGMEIFGLLAGSFLLGVIVYGVKNAAEEKKYKEYFQKQVAPELVGLLGPDFSYEQGGYISKSNVRESGFFRSFNKYECEDLVKGSIGGRKVTFAEIKLIMEKTKGSTGQAGGSRKKRKTIFNGLLLIIELETRLPGGVWILPKRRWTGAYYPDLDQKAAEAIEIDHKELGRKYRVFAEDPAFAEKLLQSTLIDKLVSLNKGFRRHKITKGDAYFLLRDNGMTMAMPLRQRFMEPRLEKPVNTREFVERLLIPLNGVYGVGEILK